MVEFLDTVISAPMPLGTGFTYRDPLTGGSNMVDTRSGVCGVLVLFQSIQGFTIRVFILCFLLLPFLCCFVVFFRGTYAGGVYGFGQSSVGIGYGHVFSIFFAGVSRVSVPTDCALSFDIL